MNRRARNAARRSSRWGSLLIDVTRHLYKKSSQDRLLRKESAELDRNARRLAVPKQLNHVENATAMEAGRLALPWIARTMLLATGNVSHMV